MWRVIWGFDPSDAFAIMPVMPLLPGEEDLARWMRSRAQAYERGEVLSICEDAVGPLLYDMLVARFDSELEDNALEMEGRFDGGFEWYGENYYAPGVCRQICSLLKRAAVELASVSDDVPVYLTEFGGVVIVEEKGTWHAVMPAGVARVDCGLIAKFLSIIADSAERQGATVVFSGP